MVSVKNVKENKNLCHDCKKEVNIRENGVLDGKELVYDDNGEKIAILKCNSCFEKNPGLNNFRKCEVYSRIVGYLRPIAQWNEGKKKEYKNRKNYKI
jgi:hypothetical protein